MIRFFKLLLLISIATSALACDEPSPNNGSDIPVTPDTPDSPQYPTQTAQVDALIEQYWEYDITNVPELIGGKTGYWQLDARFKYDAEYHNIVAIDTDFGAMLWDGNGEDVLCLSRNNGYAKVNLNENYELYTENGSWQYDARTLQLTLECGGKTTITKLSALGDEVLVLDYQRENGNIREIYKSVDYTELVCRETTLRISYLHTLCNDSNTPITFDALVGVWVLNSSVLYDDEWQDVIMPHLVFGFWHAVGGSAHTYTLNADGTGRYYVEIEEPGTEPIDQVIEWDYDTDTQLLTIDSHIIMNVVGFNGQYLIVDHNSDRNQREIYLRKE